MVTSAATPRRSALAHEAAAPRRALGVLALQGDFGAHAAALEQLGFRSVEVRSPYQLPDLAGLVIPGGESTTILKHFEIEPAWPRRLRDFAASGRFVLGTCAGLIVLARSVEPRQLSLGLLDVAVRRNGYGRQLDSRVRRAAWTGSDISSRRQLPRKRLPRQTLRRQFGRARDRPHPGATHHVDRTRRRGPCLLRKGACAGQTGQRLRRYVPSRAQPGPRHLPATGGLRTDNRTPNGSLTSFVLLSVGVRRTRAAVQASRCAS